MLLKDNTQRRPKKHERVSARKHEGVRNPTARNAVVKVPDQGYEARVDADRDAELASMRLRINALELEVSRLKREGAVSSGYAAPLAVQKGNVVPMSVARAAKAEKESAAHVSHPLPVAGNEAHVLPSPPDAEPPTKKANPPVLVHPSQAAPVTSREAANDPDLGGKEAADALRDITDVPVEDVATLALGYGLTLEELSEIAYREYAKRELHCYNRHGVSREAVRLERHIRQHTKCLPGGYVQVANAKSGFRDWWNETEAQLKILRANSAARTAAEYRSPANHGKLVKGEAKYRRKVMLRRLAANRRADRAKFGRVQDISSKLYVGGRVTTASQAKAIGTMLYGAYQSARKLLGMKPTVRNMAERVRAELIVDLENEASRQADLAKTLGVVPPDAERLSTAELVRRYQRKGIGH
jgi:hypothetical protein